LIWTNHEDFNPTQKIWDKQWKHDESIRFKKIIT